LHIGLIFAAGVLHRITRKWNNDGLFLSRFTINLPPD
jgi:hypothetical protein